MPRSLAPLVVLAATLALTTAPSGAVQAPVDRCRDPVVGVWRGTWYDASAGDWHTFRLTIGRVPGQAMRLEGHIDVEAWDGDADDRAPPPCDGARTHYDVRMAASGTTLGARITFAGRDPEITRVRCVSGSYNADTLTGEAIGGRLELRAADGSRDMGAIRFERERCTLPPSPTRPGL